LKTKTKKVLQLNNDFIERSSWKKDNINQSRHMKIMVFGALTLVDGIIGNRSKFNVDYWVSGKDLNAKSI
jgi:hypothetical protein